METLTIIKSNNVETVISYLKKLNNKLTLKELHEDGIISYELLTPKKGKKYDIFYKFNDGEVNIWGDTLDSFYQALGCRDINHRYNVTIIDLNKKIDFEEYKNGGSYV